MRKIIALALLGTLAVGCKRDSEGGPQPYEGTTIYFYSNEGGNYDIYALKIGDDAPQKVVGGPADEIHPFVFGDKIYFSAKDDGDYDVYVANIDGSGKTKITDLPNDEVQPTVSPNGRYLAFAWGTSSGLRVVLYDLQSGDTVKSLGLPNMSNHSPVFVGNDTLLMTLQDYGGAYSQDPWIYVISADTLVNLKNTPSYQEAHWNVKNGKVAFARMGLYGGDPHTVVADFPSFSGESRVYSAGVRQVYPLFAPDGGALALSHTERCLIVLVSLSDNSVDTLYQRDGAKCYTRFWK